MNVHISNRCTERGTSVTRQIVTKQLGDQNRLPIAWSHTKGHFQLNIAQHTNL